MDADSFPDAVKAAKATELDRLGSQQSLVALTDADLDAEAVLRAAAHSEWTARETFVEWAETESDDGARETFADLADREASHHERVVSELADENDADGQDVSASDRAPEGPIDPMHERLRDIDDTVERAAGLVGRSLVADRTLLQVVNFFVNEADERRADLFRELREDTRKSASTGAELLDHHCENETDRERARAVAESVVQVAYDDYAETLDGMGLDPKPVC